MEKNSLFNRNFTMVVIGQIISLFGNTILRYALPIYILNITHSAALFGAVSACSFIPMIFFAPIGGIFADRVNKRNIMVILDFSTASIIGLLTILLGNVSLIPLLITTLILLYAIQGAYQPAVQASIPVLQIPENMNSANAIINMVNSLSGILGPVIGGVVYAIYGLMPVLYISIICFICSAVMEIFIKIPFTKRKAEKSIFALVKLDMSESLNFVLKERIIIMKVCIILALINLTLSSLMIIGVPVIVTEQLGFDKELGNKLYGYSQGVLAFGGLMGGMYAGIRGKKLRIQKCWIWILACTLSLIPIIPATFIKGYPMVSYIVILLCCFVMMLVSTVSSVQMITYVQLVTPNMLIGKVMALLSCIVMCSHPIGQTLYGVLFEKLSDKQYILFIFAFTICMILSLIARKILESIQDEIVE